MRSETAYCCVMIEGCDCVVPLSLYQASAVHVGPIVILGITQEVDPSKIIPLDVVFFPMVPLLNVALKPFPDSSNQAPDPE